MGPSPRFVFRFCFAFVLGWFVAFSHDHLEAAAKPNVIVILADDLGWPDIGAQGAKDFKTPNIDSLAASGIRFRNGYVSAPVCSPSRAGLMTGRCQQRFGHEINPGPALETNSVFGLPLIESTMGDRMRNLGYKTGWVGKSHLGALPQFYPQQRGFDEFFGFLEGHHDYLYPYHTTLDDPIRRGSSVVLETNYLTTAFGRECVSFIDRHAHEPFLLYAPFNAVHFPMQAPEEYLRQFNPSDFGNDRLRYTNAAMLAVLDDAVGAILGKLRSLNLESNTVIFFTSDNGAPAPTGIDANGSVNTPLRGYKGSVYEGGIRVPFLMQWKGVLAPRVEDAVVSTLDILPTAVAAGGGGIPNAWQLDGVDLMPYLRGQTSTVPHPSLFWRIQTVGNDEVPPTPAAVREGDWKMVKPGISSRWELYNLSNDIGETTDVADLNPEIVGRLSQAYDAWNDQLATPRWDYNTRVVIQPEFVRDDLRLGSVEVSYLWPDFLPGSNWISFQDQFDQLWAGEIDLATGSLRTGSGRDVLVDSSLAPNPSQQLRAQWGWSPEGPALFYSKPDLGGRLQLWRAVLKDRSFIRTALTSNSAADHFGVRVPREPEILPFRMLFNVGNIKGLSSLVWADSIPTAVQTALLRPVDFPLNGRWLPNGEDMVYSGFAQPQSTIPQLVSYSARTKNATLITGDPGTKTDACGFVAPELNGELLFATVLNRTNIVIYRDLHNNAAGRFTNIMSFSFPPTVSQRFIASLEPLPARYGFNGVSYFTFASYANSDPANPVDSAIWILGLGPDAKHPTIRRLDLDPEDPLLPQQPGRRDPHWVIGERELFVYYTQTESSLTTQLRFARTGVDLPDSSKSSTGFTQLSYQHDFQAGTVDTNGWQMNPTETLQLLSHRGWLFAGQSSKGSRPYPTVLSDPPPEWSGAQILVKTSSVAPWTVDHTIGLSPYPFHLRVEVVKELRITTDGNGNPVTLPDGILASGLSDIGETGAKQASVRMRDDNTGLWKESHVTTANEEAFPVSFLSRQEAGVTRVYTGLSNGHIHRGAYSSSERNLTWNTNAEFSGTGPVLGLTEANSVLYAAGGLVQAASNSPVSGGVYMRNDTNKTWQLVYRWPYPTDLYAQSNEVRLMQSLTAVPEPHGKPYQVLLATRFWPGIIERIDPKKGHQVTTELDVHDFLARQWNDERWRKASIRLGSQGFTSSTNPVTGERVHLTGLWAESPDPAIRPTRRPTFLVRFLDGTYELASGDVPGQTSDLRATRCIAQSPFLDQPGAIYLGGYDILGDTNSNTGWILRGEWSTWPKILFTAPNPPEWKLEWESTDTAWILERNASLDPLSAWQPVPGLSTRSNTNQTQSISPQDPVSFYRLRKP